MAIIDVSNTEIVITDGYFANTISDMISVKKDLVKDGLLDYGFVDPAFRYNIVSQ